MRNVFLFILLTIGYSSVCGQIIAAEDQGETRDPVVIEFPGNTEESLSEKAHAWLDNHPWILKLHSSKCLGFFEETIDRDKSISLGAIINVETENEKIIVSFKNISLHESPDPSNNYKPGRVDISNYRTQVDRKLESLLVDLENWIKK